MATDNSNSWLEYTVTTAVGLIAAIVGYIYRTIWREIAEVRKEVKEVKASQVAFVEKIQAGVNDGERTLWNALDQVKNKLELVASREEIESLRSSMEQDRKEAAADRVKIAEQMIKREELTNLLDKQYDRLVGLMKR